MWLYKKPDSCVIHILIQSQLKLQDERSRDMKREKETRGEETWGDSRRADLRRGELQEHKSNTKTTLIYFFTYIREKDKNINKTSIFSCTMDLSPSKWEIYWILWIVASFFLDVNHLEVKMRGSKIIQNIQFP